MKQIVTDYWPVMAAVGAGLIAWGSLNAEVNKLQNDAAVAKSDHDLIVEMRTEQAHIREDVKDIKDILSANSKRRP